MNKWIRRRRNTLGYGVQSPSDFYFVRHVLRETLPYYAYEVLHEAVGTHGTPRDEAVLRLLFRLVNHVRPTTMLHVGYGTPLASYSMQLACPKAHAINITGDAGPDQLAEALQTLGTVELMHITHTPHYRELVQQAMPHLCSKTLLIIEGIDTDKTKHAWWEELRQSPLTGVSYDLGGMGLLFFDKNRYKDTYWVRMQSLIGR